MSTESVKRDYFLFNEKILPTFWKKGKGMVMRVPTEEDILFMSIMNDSVFISWIDFILFSIPTYRVDI